MAYGGKALSLKLDLIQLTGVNTVDYSIIGTKHLALWSLTHSLLVISV